MSTEDNETAETLTDRRRVEDGYALVNAIWKTQGSAAALRYCHHVPYGRALPLGLDLAEIDRVIATMNSFYGGSRDWPTQWFKAGDDYMERARNAERLVTAKRQPKCCSPRRRAITWPGTCTTTSDDRCQ